jgi:hypothetical protein
MHRRLKKQKHRKRLTHRKRLMLRMLRSRLAIHHW